MRPRDPLRTLSATAAATALTVSLCAPALASTATWTVSPGGRYVSHSAEYWFLQDDGTKYKIPCNDVSARFHFKSGTGLTNPIGIIKSISLNNCGYGGTANTFSVLPVGLPWAFRALSYDPSTGATRGVVLNVHFTVTGASCSAVIDGTGPTAYNGQLQFYWDNGSNVFDIGTKGTRHLHVYNVSGCSGVFSNGDPILANGAYTMPASLTITSP